jgi:hypothetical protein
MARVEMIPLPLQQKHVEGARLFADRLEMIRSLTFTPRPIVAELGVAYGDFSRFLIDQLQPERFHAYDYFLMHEHVEIWGRPTAETFKGLTHSQFYKKRFRDEIARGQCQLFEGDSATNLSERKDGTYDMIYIDAGHSLESVMRDAAVSVKKLHPDGILVFNDYIMFDHIANMAYGVVQVVNDLCVNRGWRITHYALHRQMFCDVVVQRQKIT